jgi:hypothetical protein
VFVVHVHKQPQRVGGARAERVLRQEKPPPPRVRQARVAVEGGTTVGA